MSVVVRERGAEGGGEAGGTRGGCLAALPVAPYTPTVPGINQIYFTYICISAFTPDDLSRGVGGVWVRHPIQARHRLGENIAHSVAHTSTLCFLPFVSS